MTTTNTGGCSGRAASSPSSPGAEHGSNLGRQRWVVERGFAHLYNFRRLRTRYERDPEATAARGHRGERAVLLERVRHREERRRVIVGEGLAGLRVQLVLERAECPRRREGIGAVAAASSFAF
jgi:hypothetical protein